MNWVDASILIVTALSFTFGIWRGLVREVLSLITWILALLVARSYSEVVAATLFNSFDNLTMRFVTAFALIFIGVMMLGTFVNFLMSKLLIFTGLRFVDRILGGLFGIARGALIVLVGLFFSSFFLSQGEYWQNSKLIPYGQTMIEMSRSFIQDRGDAEVS
ncbi:MAG: bacteriocin production protein [Gammaproteobacteria bacterium]|nr:bacteriocin production protein [Gammaproteobacteria bacterium]